MNLGSWTGMNRLYRVTVVGSQVAYKMVERWPRSIPVDIKSNGIFNVRIRMLYHITSIVWHWIWVILRPQWCQLSRRSWMKARNGLPKLCGRPVIIFNSHTAQILCLYVIGDCVCGVVRFELARKGLSRIRVRKGRQN